MGLKPRVLREKRSLRRAVEKDRAKLVAELLAGGADVEEREWDGKNLLFEARSRTVVELLIRAGLDCNDCDKHGWTPLHRAAARGRVATARALLDLGADPSRLDREGESAANLAATRELRDLLGAAPETPSLHSLGDDRLVEPLLAGQLDVARELVAAGAALESHAGAGVWLVREAARAGRRDLIEFAAACGLPIDDDVSMFDAVENDHLDVAAYLLEHGAGPRCQTTTRASLFSVVKSASMAELLVAAGVRPDAADTLTGTALHRAARFGDPRIVEVILAAGVDPNIGDKHGHVAESSFACVRDVLARARARVGS